MFKMSPDIKLALLPRIPGFSDLLGEPPVPSESFYCKDLEHTFLRAGIGSSVRSTFNFNQDFSGTAFQITVASNTQSHHTQIVPSQTRSIPRPGSSHSEKGFEAFNHYISPALGRNSQFLSWAYTISIFLQKGLLSAPTFLVVFIFFVMLRSFLQNLFNDIWDVILSKTP